MNTIFVIFISIWIVVNLFILILNLYIRFLSSKFHETLYEHKIKKIQRRFSK